MKHTGYSTWNVQYWSVHSKLTSLLMTHWQNNCIFHIKHSIQYENLSMYLCHSFFHLGEFEQVFQGKIGPKSEIAALCNNKQW